MWETWWAVRQIGSWVLGITLISSGMVEMNRVEVDSPLMPSCVIEILPSPTPTPIRIVKPTINQTNPLNLNEVVNEFRITRGLPGLRVREDLCQAANLRSQQILTDFSHNGFEAVMAGIPHQQVAENIWRGEPFSLERVIDDWDKSAGHKENLLGDYVYGCGATINQVAIMLFLW